MMEISVPEAAERLVTWSNSSLRVLNVAGPRASKDPAIYSKVREVLKMVLNGRHHI
jgi:hypothetical protein